MVTPPGPPRDRPPTDVDLERGLELCRNELWDEGLPLLARAAERGERFEALPGLVYSYLGYGLALRDRRVAEGIRLCRHAIKVEFYQPESYLNLARAELLAGNRRGAQWALDQGLRVDEAHPGLQALRHELGIRRPPVLPMISRDNPLNRLLGKLRYLLTGP
jgi:hypothetical protein